MTNSSHFLGFLEATCSHVRVVCILTGQDMPSKKKHQRHTMIARFLPIANDSAASSPQ